LEEKITFSGILYEFANVSVKENHAFFVKISMIF